MRLKSYYSGTVERAIAQARQELGEDAMLIHSHRTTAEFSHLGAYEVVFAITIDAAMPRPALETVMEASKASHVDSPGAPRPRDASFDPDYARLKKELTNLAIFLEDGTNGGPLDGVSQLLSDQGVHPELVFELLRDLKTQTLYNKVSPEKLLALLCQNMESRIRTEAAMTSFGNSTKVAALIGPPGCGKTTTLAKLAARFGLSSRRPCLLVSADNYRIGSSDQLRSLAAILGVAFDTAVTPAALAQTIEENRNKDLILIDTPGLSSAEMEDHAEWARFFSTRVDIEKHLILSASMKNADLSFVVDQYRVFDPNRLLFTKLDETATRGAIWSEAVRTGIPLSYWTTGQKIPEDIAEASKQELLDAILKQERRPRSAIAGM